MIKPTSCFTLSSQTILVLQRTETQDGSMPVPLDQLLGSSAYLYNFIEIAITSGQNQATSYIYIYIYIYTYNQINLPSDVVEDMYGTMCV